VAASLGGEALTTDKVEIAQLLLIKSYLERYGWEYEADGIDALMTGFTIGDETFTLSIRCADDVVYLTIPHIADAPLLACVHQTYQYLLQANCSTALTKFGLDEAGHIVLAAELPANLLSYELFVCALFMLGFNAQAQKDILNDVTSNPGFVSPYSRIRESK
jgi:hypothetical protein